MSDIWSEFAKTAEEARSFLVVSHVNPDPDAVGSVVGLARYLETLSKSVRMVTPSPIPENCRFLDPKGEIVLFDQTRADALLGAVDVAIILDLSSWNQLGEMGAALKESDAYRVVIDHHTDPDEDIADLMVRDPGASATGVLIYELIRELGGKVTLPIATALFAAIMTDTGSFRFSNTDGRTFRVVADLIDAGVRPDDVYRRIYEGKRWGTVKLLPAVFATVERSANGKIAWMHANRTMLSQAGASFEDTDGYIDHIRAVKGVEVALFFKEVDSGRVRVSLRSQGGVDVARFAASMGGGGHTRAAGLAFEGTLEEAIAKVVPGLESLLRSHS